MAKSKSENCGNCRFLVPSDEVPVEAEGEEDNRPGGYCHHSAPAPQMSGMMIEDGIDIIWPWVDESDWCGKWEA